MRGRSNSFPNVDLVALAEAASKQEYGLHQMPLETPKAYKTFLQFCMLGPSARYTEIASASGVTKSTVATFRARYHWNARVEDWWHVRQQQLASCAGGAPLATQDWEGRRAAARREEWELGQRLIQSGKEALERWRGSDRVPSLGDVAKMFELGTRLMRLAAGLPLNHTELSGSVEAPIRLEWEEALQRVYGKSEVIEAEVVGETVPAVAGQGDGETVPAVAGQGDGPRSRGAGGRMRQAMVDGV